MLEVNKDGRRHMTKFYGRFNIIENENFCKIFAKDPTYSELQPASWKYNVKLIMN